MQVTIEEIEMLSSMLARAMSEVGRLTVERDELRRMYEAQIHSHVDYSTNHTE